VLPRFITSFLKGLADKEFIRLNSDCIEKDLMSGVREISFYFAVFFTEIFFFLFMVSPLPELDLLS
jgi:hypothetical protein